jgi:hypothetical protein
MNSSRTRDWRRAQRDRYLVKRAHRTLRHRVDSERVEKPGYFSKVKGFPKYAELPCIFANKDWKLMYLRSLKLIRAKQLKTFYPRRAWVSAIEDLLLPSEE